MKRSTKTSLLSGSIVLLAAGASTAHVGVASGPAIAGKSQLITFSIGHGCEGADTLSARAELPEDIASVRTATSDLGPGTIEFDDAELPIAVTWAKPESELLDADTNYYRMDLRLSIPDVPFTKLYFPVEQVCQDSEGTQITVNWDAIEADHDSEEEPAASLIVLPERFPGWNQYTVPEDIEHLEEFFSDALIVWRGDEAYSPNPATAELIADTSGVSELTSLEADDEIWVKY